MLSTVACAPSTHHVKAFGRVGPGAHGHALTLMILQGAQQLQPRAILR